MHFPALPSYYWPISQKDHFLNFHHTQKERKKERKKNQEIQMQNQDQKKKNPKGKKNKFLGQIWNKNAELKEIKKEN